MQRLRNSALITVTVATLAACASDIPTALPRTGNTVANSVVSPPPGASAPFFVIGDVENHDLGATVNFWGDQWWTNNRTSQSASPGVASFKGYTDISTAACGGTWSASGGNSLVPPDTIPADVAVIVTSSATKDGMTVGGDIKQILIVHSDGGYGPSPGHPGGGVVTQVTCTQ